MNILVIGGSPKGKYSCTLQTVLYLQKRYPEHAFEILHAGNTIRKLEKDFSPAREMIERAELLLFCYPVYTFIAPSQLHRFIALLKKSGIDFTGKYATQITTSKHFYDVTAHRYIQENCDDLGLNFVEGLSADMDDLTHESGQKDAERFFEYVLWCMDRGICEPKRVPNTPPKHCAVTVPAEAKPKQGGKKIALVADLAPEDTQLAAMISRFRADCGYETRLVNIHEFRFAGGCISCFNCSTDGTCIYKDGFSDLLRNEIQTCNAIVLAFSICDHSMGPVFKTYDDRQFCNGHRTVTMGMPFGYLISGNYSEEANLKMIIDGRAEVGGNFLAGTATDEFDPDTEIDTLCARLGYAMEQGYSRPANFFGVGGMKIFRDLIWLMQGMMKADHKFYKAHHQYDFPQKQRGTMMAMYLVGAMMASPKLKKKMGNKMNEGMLMPYKKVLDHAKPKNGNE